ncbi:hypothetical protein HY772_00205 [Candidatus Woesearchaeota archaeon]|nr:hypothetical protein [Candidatus Woesearchaeota archaeon]
MMPETPSGKEDTADDMYLVDDSMPRRFEQNDEQNEKPAAEHHENAPSQQIAKKQIAKKTTVQKTVQKKAAAKNLDPKPTEEKEKKEIKEKEITQGILHKSPRNTTQQPQELKSEKSAQPKKSKYVQTSEQAKKEAGVHQQKKRKTKKELHKIKKELHKKMAESSTPSKHATPSKFKIILWVVAIIAIVGVLLFVKSREVIPDAKIHSDDETTKQIPEKPTKPVIEKEKYNDDATTLPEKKTLGDSVVAQESLKNLESIDVTENPELFANLKCTRDAESGLRYISLRLYNTLQEDLKISHVGVAKGFNTYFSIRGLVDTDPGCNKELLQPGESTVCDKIGFDQARYGLALGINRISAQVPGKTEALLVKCSE